MKRMRLAICVAVFALVGGIALSEDMDIRALQAKLAAQEARLNDLQAKMSVSRNAGTPEGIVSMRKNAVVTIGGTVNTRYYFRTGKVEERETADSGFTRTRDHKSGDLRLSDAKLAVKIDVNDHFDAYLRMDLHDGARDDGNSIAQYYWVRWKNICNSGFGVLVGRDNLVFADSQPIGVFGSYVKKGGELIGDVGYRGMYGDFSAWDHSRVTQITPYWENQDGSFKAELSLFQSINNRSGLTHTKTYSSANGTEHTRSINYGLGSGSLRLTWKPIEGLKLTASAMNRHAKNGWRGANEAGDFVNDWRFSYVGGANRNEWDTNNNNPAINLAFQYRPCFFNRMNIFGQWTHGWNEGWIDGLDSNAFTLGASFDVTDKLAVFAMGDYMRLKGDSSYKAKGWAVSAGATYNLGYGVNLEAGWRHERMNNKLGGTTMTKIRANVIYGHLGFAF